MKRLLLMFLSVAALYATSALSESVLTSERLADLARTEMRGLLEKKGYFYPDGPLRPAGAIRISEINNLKVESLGESTVYRVLGVRTGTMMKSIGEFNEGQEVFVHIAIAIEVQYDTDSSAYRSEPLVSLFDVSGSPDTPIAMQEAMDSLIVYLDDLVKGLVKAVPSLIQESVQQVRDKIRDKPVIVQHIGVIDSFELDADATMKQVGKNNVVFAIRGSKGSGSVAVTIAVNEEETDITDVIGGTLLMEDGSTFDLPAEPINDPKQVAMQYRQAAEQGNVMAMVSLGAAYQRGEGVEKDYAEAARWYRKAADRGYPDAMASLGWLYHVGRGVQQDREKAVMWYRKAAEQGNAPSMNNLGWAYDQGLGVEQDREKAIMWYRRAAQRGDARAMVNVGWAYYQGRGVERDPGKAVTWYRKAAEQGSAQAMTNLGWAYEQGHGVRKNYNEAVKWYRKAAAQGNKDAEKALTRFQ